MAKKAPEKQPMMKPISASDAFLIFEKWRDEQPQVHLSMRKKDGSSHGSSPVSIISTSEGDGTLDAQVVVDGKEQRWRVDWREASYLYGEPSDSAVYPEFVEGKWASYLVVDAPTTMDLFAERFAER
jgi:hypothetical protein